MGGGKSTDRLVRPPQGERAKNNGYRRSAVVLADRFDGRSRRTTRGPARPGVKSARKRQGLAAPPSSTGGASSRRSVGSRPRAAKLSGRWRVRVRGQARKRKAERASVDGRRPGALQASLLDGTEGEDASSGGQRFGAARRRKGRQRKWSSPGMRKTTPLTRGCGPRALSIEDPQDRPAPDVAR